MSSSDDDLSVTSELNQGTASASAPAPRVPRGAGGHDGAAPDAPPTNRASDKCNEVGKHRGDGSPSSPYFQPLRWGVDSLYESAYGQLDENVDRRLKELKQLAQSQETHEQAKAQYPVGDHIFEVKDKGSRLYPYALEDGAFRIQLSRSKRLPWAYAKVSAGFLAAHTPQAAEDALLAILGPLGTVEGPLKVGRIDLFVDFVSSVDMESWKRTAWVTRAKAVDQHAVDGAFTGWSIGLGGILSCRLYDKTKEIEVSKKFYLVDLWREAGWDGESPIWRLEFEFKRELLAQLQLMTLSEVLSNLNGLWSYATTEWLRLTLPSSDDKTRSRWPIHPLWGCLSSIDWETNGGPLSRQHSPKRIPSEEKLCQLWTATLVSFMAARGITDRYQGVDAMQEAVERHFTSKADYLGLPLDNYIRERVQAKARVFNSMLNDPTLVDELKAEELERAAKAYLRASKG